MRCCISLGRRIKNALFNRRGSAYLIVLATLLLVVVMGGSVLLASYATVGNAARKHSRQQTYYYMQSAGELVRQMITQTPNNQFTPIFVQTIENQILADYQSDPDFDFSTKKYLAECSSDALHIDDRIINLSVQFEYVDISVTPRYPSESDTTYEINATLRAITHIEYDAGAGSIVSDTLTSEYLSYEDTSGTGPVRQWTFSRYSE